MGTSSRRGGGPVQSQTLALSQRGAARGRMWTGCGRPGTRMRTAGEPAGGRIPLRGHGPDGGGCGSGD